MSVTRFGGSANLVKRVSTSMTCAAVKPAGGGVPQRERRQAIGVDVLRGLLQLGEREQGVAGLGVERVVDFEQDGAVALHDRRIAGLYRHDGHTPMEVAVRSTSVRALS